MADVRRQRTDDRGQMSEDGRQRTDVRGRKTEVIEGGSGNYLNSEVGIRKERIESSLLSLSEIFEYIKHKTGLIPSVHDEILKQKFRDCGSGF